MSIRAVILDIYRTLLHVGPPAPDAEARWVRLLRQHWTTAPRLTLEEFRLAGEAAIAREHAKARAIGIAHPEIFWPAIARIALPELSSLSDGQCDEFLFQHAQLARSVALSPGARDALADLCERKLLLGIASNAQPYTVRELALAMETEGLSMKIFDPGLCFWSFEAGFSKPDPHVFRWLGARLLQRGIAPSETLMVGDRQDNDITPAGAQGWQTWLFGENPPVSGQGGSWEEFHEKFDALNS